MWPTKSPESCRCMSAVRPWSCLLSLPPAPFWSHPGGGRHPASFLSALSIQCCRSLSSLLTHPLISGTWTHVKPALCKPGEKEAATIFEPFQPWARPAQDTPARPPRHASSLGLTPPPGHILSSLDSVFPCTCASPRRVPSAGQPSPQDTPRP